MQPRATTRKSARYPVARESRVTFYNAKRCFSCFEYPSLPSSKQKKYPPAKPEALWLVAPQSGLDKIAPRRQQLITRAVGAMVISPALQRGETEFNSPQSPVGTALMPCAFPTFSIRAYP
jgi:hypothetical protein